MSSREISDVGTGFSLYGRAQLDGPGRLFWYDH
jgi:hypothetical protein